MFTKPLHPDTLRAIKLTSSLDIIKNSYLAGGTALALQIGHRESVDLDFFTANKFSPIEAASELKKISSYTHDSESTNTILGKISDTRFSLFYYEYPVLKPFLDFEGIQLAAKEDIAAMKIHALQMRGTTRDFVDVYFLAKEYTLENMLDFYDQKYASLDTHLYSIIRSLNYFEDAENESQMPKMIVSANWSQIKDFFEKEAKRISKKYLHNS